MVVPLSFARYSDQCSVVDEEELLYSRGGDLVDVTTAQATSEGSGVSGQTDSSFPDTKYQTTSTINT